MRPVHTSKLLAGTASTFLLAGAAAALLRYAVMGRRSQFFGPSVFRGAGKRRSVALTFDDGPSPGSLILARYLLEHGVAATFFLCGENVARHPEIAGELARMGFELGNHGYSHRRLPPRMGRQLNLRSAEAIYREFAQAQRAIQTHTGRSPTLLRAPYGLRWFGLRSAFRRLALLGVHWTVIGHDWAWSAGRVAEQVLHHVRPGAIVCLHDGRETRVDPDILVTLEAVRLILPELKRRGYEFETVSALLDRP